jgi:FlaA1/EpsC-like NDP-sugar epimerase
MSDRWSSLLDRPEFALPPGELETVVGGKSILITGAAGTVGRELAGLILNGRPARLVLVDSHEASLVRLISDLETNNERDTERQFLLADVRDRRKVDQTLRRIRCDVVFHLAAYKQVPLAETNVDQVLDVNVLGTSNVFESAAEHGVSTFTLPSTDKAVNPFGVYGATKRIVERYLTSFAGAGTHPAIRVARLVNVLGSQGSVAEIFARQIDRDQPIGITDVQMDRYWMTMDEATRLLVASAGRPEYEGTYLLDVGAAVPLLETARRLYRISRPNGGEPRIRIIGVRPGERLHELLRYDDEVRRETRMPGLYALSPPRPTIDFESWRRGLAELRQLLNQISPQALRAWAFAAATQETLPGLALQDQ